MKSFLKSKNNTQFIHDLWPGIIAIYSLQKANKPYVRLKNSIGIFRAGNEKASEWKHLWWKFALIDWPIFSEKMYEKKWLNKIETKLSKKVFTHIFKYLCWRIDILLGLNFKRKISPWLLFKYHGNDYIFALIKSPISFIKEFPKKIFLYLKN